MNSVTVKDLRKHYGGADASREVLQGASLSVEAAHSLAVMGPSGSGKSTLLNIIGTLDNADGGSIDIFGQNPFALKESELAHFRCRTIGFIFQSHHLLPQCSVLENVLLPAIAAREGKDKSSVEKNPEERAKRLIERAGLTHRINARPGQMSGGECQRAAVVRALINAPKLLLADEPTGSLDRVNADAIAELLCEIVREEKAALIAVTHSMDFARRMDAVMELKDGILK